jgi:hypothetical protein
MAAVKKNRKDPARYTFEVGDWMVEIDQIPQVHSFGEPWPEPLDEALR